MNESIKYYNEILVNFSNIAIWVLLIPIFVAIVYREQINQPLKVMVAYLLAIICSNLLTLFFIWFVSNYQDISLPYLKKFQITDTNFLGINSILIDYIFVGWIFSFALSEPWASRVKWGSWGLIPLAILVYFFVDGFRAYGTVNAILNRGYLVVVPALYFWYLFNSTPNLSLWQNPFFLFGLGLFVPNLFGFIMSFVGDKLNETDYVAFVKVSIFRNCLTILAQFFFAYAFYQARYAKYLVVKQ